MKPHSHEFYEYIPGFGYATYEDEDGFWWEFLDAIEGGPIGGMGPFPTRSKALEEAMRDWGIGDILTDHDQEYVLTLLEHADYYRYEEDNDD